MNTFEYKHAGRGAIQFCPGQTGESRPRAQEEAACVQIGTGRAMPRGLIAPVRRRLTPAPKEKNNT
jgi:hypothetical protein